jgi:hypothetical protein
VYDKILLAQLGPIFFYVDVVVRLQTKRKKLRPLLFLLRCSSVGIQISVIELFAARKQRLIQQTSLKLAGYALESLLSTHVTGKQGGLVDFEMVRKTGMYSSHWSDDCYVRYDKFVQYMQEQWHFGVEAAEIGTEALTKLPSTKAADGFDTKHAVTKNQLLQIADTEFTCDTERQAVKTVIKLVCWLVGDEHPLTTELTQQQIEIALARPVTR